MPVTPLVPWLLSCSHRSGGTPGAHDFARIIHPCHVDDLRGLGGDRDRHKHGPTGEGKFFSSR